MNPKVRRFFKSFWILGMIVLLLGKAIPVSADGMMFKKGYDYWELATEEKQYCAINYKDGVQNMMLSIDPGMDFKGEKAVWLFPVPASPEQTTINIFDQFPPYGGQDLLEEARDSVEGAILGMRMYHYLTGAPIIFMTGVTFGSRGMSGRVAKMYHDSLSDSYGVTVHEHIEKKGIASETLSATNADGLYRYFIDKGLQFDQNAKNILKEYIGGGYCFVVSWIFDLEQYGRFHKDSKGGRVPYYLYDEEESMGTVSVFISFPTEKIYFPLKPTSIYGDQKIPVDLYIEGFVSPQFYPELNNVLVRYIQRDYRRQKDVASESMNAFLFGQEKFGPDYTKVKINAPSSDYVQDLWISPEVPLVVNRAQKIIRRSFWLDILGYLLLSCLASIFSGLVLFNGKGHSLMKWVLLGLFNLLSLLGFSIAAYRFHLNRNADGSLPPAKISLGKCASKVVWGTLIFVGICMGGLLSVAFVKGEISNFGLEDLYHLSIVTLILFIGIYIFVLPIVWGAYNDRRTLVYIFLFSAAFFALTSIAKIGLLSLLG